MNAAKYKVSIGNNGAHNCLLLKRCHVLLLSRDRLKLPVTCCAPRSAHAHVSPRHVIAGHALRFSTWSCDHSDNITHSAHHVIMAVGIMIRVLECSTMRNVFMFRKLMTMRRAPAQVTVQCVALYISRDRSIRRVHKSCDNETRCASHVTSRGVALSTCHIDALCISRDNMALSLRVPGFGVFFKGLMWLLIRIRKYPHYFNITFPIMPCLCQVNRSFMSCLFIYHKNSVYK